MHRLKQRYLMVFIALLTLSSVMFSGCSLLEDKHVTLVKEGTMEIVPNVKAKVQFVILNDTRFQLWTIEINGDNMRDSDAIAVMKKILTQYHAK